MDKKRTKTIIFLHIILLIYSLSGICSKNAGGVPFLSVEFFFYYGLLLLIMAFYAIAWQQIIKSLPLTTAFANKAVTVVWGMIWGTVIFKENITFGKLIGALLVILGVVVYSYADREDSYD